MAFENIMELQRMCQAFNIDEATLNEWLEKGKNIMMNNPHADEKFNMYEKVSYDTFVSGSQKFIEQSIANDDGVTCIDTRDGYDAIILPQHKTIKSAGADISSPYSFTLAPNQSIVIPTGLKVKIPDGTFLAIYPRSSYGMKYGVMLMNTVGIIDADYYNNSDNEGHILVAIRNTGDKTLDVKQGDRFCQGICQPYVRTDNMSTDERTGGVGSTGK